MVYGSPHPYAEKIGDLPRVPRHDPLDQTLEGVWDNLNALPKVWTPAQLRYLLHFYVTTSPFPDPERASQHFAESMALFSHHGIVTRHNGGKLDREYSLTELGNAFIQMLIATPLPQRQFVDPRSQRVIE